MPNPAKKPPQYHIELPAFTGPLDLLLHLIEREELDVTAISLTRVTAQYLDQVENMKQDKIDQLIDFLVIGARLVLVKSRALLPRPPSSQTSEEEEEDPAEALLRQLRQYKQFKQAAGWLRQREEAGLRTYLRLAPPPRIEQTPDLSGLTLAALLAALHEALARSEIREESVEVVQRRRITIEGQLRHLRHTLGQQEQISFRELLSAKADVVEVAITLLAILEMIKRREVMVHQAHPFGPIEVVALDLSSGSETDAKEWELAPTPTLPPEYQ